jgi:hypothetical protein
VREEATTREKVRAAEQANRGAQRALADAEQLRDHDIPLADALEAKVKAEAALAAAENEILEHQRQLPAIESEIHKLDKEFGTAVASTFRPLRARAAENFRAAVRQMKAARDEYVALGEVLGELDRNARMMRVPDLEDGHHDPMYARATERPQFLLVCWPIRLALREAEQCFSLGARGTV